MILSFDEFMNEFLLLVATFADLLSPPLADLLFPDLLVKVKLLLPLLLISLLLLLSDFDPFFEDFDLDDFDFVDLDLADLECNSRP